MTHDEFAAYLGAHGYKYNRTDAGIEVIGSHVYLDSLTTLPEGTTFSNGGHVYLGRLTTLPEGTTFSNDGHVYLGSLTTLPEGTTFSNDGHVDLPSLTTLPEGATFSNDGHVYLNRLTTLTTLPEGATFSNDGYVDLPSLTTLPDGTTFSNDGHVYLDSLTNEQQTYRGQTIRLKIIDGYTMLILSERTMGDNTIYHAACFGGGDLDKLKRCYVASNGEYHAHGRTVELALRDLRFKVAERDFDEDEIVAEIKARGTVLIEDFRLITGACEEGTRRGMQDAGLDPDANELPLPVVLGAAFGSYGEKFKSLFREVVA